MNGNNQEGRSVSYSGEQLRVVQPSLPDQVRRGVAAAITALRELAGEEPKGDLSIRLAAAQELAHMPSRYALPLVAPSLPPFVLDPDKLPRYDELRDSIRAENPAPAKPDDIGEIYPRLLDIARKHLDGAGSAAKCLVLDNGRFEVIAGTPDEVRALLPSLIGERCGIVQTREALLTLAASLAARNGGQFMLATDDGMSVLAYGSAEQVNRMTTPTQLDPRRDNGTLVPAYPDVIVEADMQVKARDESFPGENALMKAAIATAEWMHGAHEYRVTIGDLGYRASYRVFVGTLEGFIAEAAVLARQGHTDGAGRIDLFSAAAAAIARTLEPCGAYLYDVGDGFLAGIGSDQGLCNALIRKMAAHRGGTDALLRAAAVLFLSQHNGEPAETVILSPTDGGEERMFICGTRDNCIAALARSLPRGEMQPLASDQPEHAHFTRAVPTPYRITSADPGSAAFRSRWWLWLDPNDDSKALMVPSIQDAVTGPLMVTLHGLALHFEQSAL